MTTDKKQIKYKETLNLPETTLSMRANAAVREIEIQKFWEENKIYEQIIKQRSPENSFVLHDGPPYLSSEKIHVGTALNKILKDILVKYKSMRGFYAPYVPGYDGHGLPIENAVVKKIKGGRNSISELELRFKCREFAHKNLKGQECEFKRLGVLGNWENPYLTINPEYEAEQVRVFGEMYKKNYIEKGLKPVYWCAACETALAEAEVEYSDITSASIYVRFKFDEKSTQKLNDILKLNSIDMPIYAVIWTTTPWTIPSNLAICLNPGFEYTFFEHKGSIYFTANELTDKFLKDVEWDNIEIIGSCKGRDLEFLETYHPLCERKSPIILGEHVTLDAGTGAVHTAPGHGLEDYEVCRKYNIRVFSPIDNRGNWTNESGISELSGIPYYKGNEMLIEMLQNKGALLKRQDIRHSYPHCWRCKNPVIYRATPQWFVKIDKFRNKALEEIKNVKWTPSGGEARIGNMVQNRSDWCISRQRTWGVPIPVFYCENCSEVICTDETIERIAGIFEKESSDAWIKYTAEEFLPSGYKCPKCGSLKFKKEKDIMDVWFDSGISWHAVVDKRSDELGHCPVDLYLEGSDQDRGWFQSSLLTSVAVNEKAPYKGVLTHGFVFGEDGRKMSKSLGNYIRPDDIIKNYGADILRLWAASVDYRNDIKIGNIIISQLAEIFKKIRNTARFLLGNIYDFNPAEDYVCYSELKIIDKYALHKLNNLIKDVTNSFDNYEFYKYFQSLQNFTAVDLSSFYLDIIKDRLYTAGKKSLSRRACQTVMYEILHTLVRILAPVLPHQAEDIWQNMPEILKNGINSVLLTNWPNTHAIWKNEILEADFSKILKVRDVVTRAIEPLRAAKVIGSSLEAAVYISSAQDEVLKLCEQDLSDIFITSQVYLTDKLPEKTLNEYTSDGVTVRIAHADGEKCERCWKYRKLENDKNYGKICRDCLNAVKDMDAVNT